MVNGQKANGRKQPQNLNIPGHACPVSFNHWFTILRILGEPETRAPGKVAKLPKWKG